MQQLTGMDESSLIDGLQGVIFRDPVKSEWQTADEYLSGNVRQKLREAEQAASADPAYLPNVEALRSSQPKDLDASEIEVRLGATWIDQKYIQQFMEETFEPPYYLRRSIHNPRKRRSPLAEQKAQLVSALEAKQNQGRGHYYDLSIQNQISLTLHLDHEDEPELTIALYRCDGSKCLAVVDGKSVAYVPRGEMVTLAEAVRAIALN